MGKFTISIEDEKHGNHTMVFEYDDIDWSESKGVTRIYDKSDKCIEIKHNGQSRIAVKAWKGCASYDSFEAETPAYPGGAKAD